MRKLLLAVCLSMLALSSAYANDISKKTGKPLTDQQQKMRDCSAEAKAKGLHKADRKAYMKECLGRGKGEATPAKAAKAAKADAPAPAAMAEEKGHKKGKMKACNAEAKTKDLSGDERKAFMSDCLKG